MIYVLFAFITFSIALTAYSAVRIVGIRRSLAPQLFGSDETDDLDDSTSDQMPVGISQEALAAVESSLQELEMVVLVAHRIERPSDAIRAAVEENLARSVQYRFLTSPTTPDEIETVYFEDYKTSARAIKAKFGLPLPLEKMVKLDRLTFEWDDFPYIFYRLRKRVGTGSRHTIHTLAFRGLSRTAGLAETYEAVPPALAQSLVRMLLVHTPELRANIGDLERDRFSDSDEVSLSSIPNKVLTFVTPEAQDELRASKLNFVH